MSIKQYITIALVLVVIAGNGCTKKGIRTGPLVCTMHGIHNCYNKSDIAQCIGVDEKSIDDYYIFSESVSGDSYANESKLKSLVCDKIVDEVMLRIQMIYTNKQFQRWHFTEMSLPVIFRTFVQKENHKQMVVMGFVKKDDLSAKAIIYYLPLEYKMDIIGREKNNYKPQPDW